MLSANFKPRTAAVSRGFLATARLSCSYFLHEAKMKTLTGRLLAKNVNVDGRSLTVMVQ